MKRVIFFCSLLAAAIRVVAVPPSLSAQVANNTTMVGTVVDSSGAPVAGAKVTALNEGTKVAYPGTTNNDGYYSIPFIQPGTYDVTIEMLGFTKVTQTGKIVPIDQAVRTDFKLTVGSEATSVTVSASSPPIATDDASLGETFNTKAVEDLPLLGHNALEVAATASNVVIGPTSSYSGVPPGEDFIGAGQREIQNSLNLDGVSIMNNLISLAPARPSSDMISEVQMQSGNYPAQYGSYLGLHINLVSKSGTNNLHGAVYDYIQNTSLNAAPFLNSPESPTPVQHYNQYGFDLGGPVYLPKLYNGRNKTFFFASYEKINQVQQSQSISSTLTPAMRAGDFSALLPSTQLVDPFTGQPYVNNQIPASELALPSAQIAKSIEQYMTAPNLPGTTNNLNAVFPSNLFIHQTLDRVDENIGDKVRIFVRYHWQNLQVVGGDPFPTNASYGPTKSRNTAIGYTHFITPNLINDFHVGLNTVTSNNLNYFAQNGINGAGTALGIPGFNADTAYNNPGVPSFTLSNYNEIGNDASNWYQDDRTIDGYEQVTWTHGKHSIMAGAELRKLTIGREAANDPRGVFNFQGVTCKPEDSNGPLSDTNPCTDATSTGYGAADFVLGLAQSDTTPVFPAKGSIGEWRDGFFVLDNWQPFQKLTLNYGLRYELPTVPYSLNGYARILNASETALIPASNASTAADFVPTPGFKFNGPNHDDWAPRIGFAYRATETTTLRGGFGIYYNANQLNTYTLTTQNYPLAATVSYSTLAKNLMSLTNPTPGAASASPVAGVPGTYVSATTVPQYLPTQTLYQWNLSWGQELWRNAGFELQYLGSHAIHLDRDFYDNQPLEPSADVTASINSRRPNQLFGTIRRIQNDEYSHYNGLTAILRQRAVHGVSATLSYTWSHDLDITDNSNGGYTTMDQYNIARDYGSSDWDMRNRFVGTVTYDLPSFAGSKAVVKEAIGGWQANAIVTVQSGTPYNVNLGFDNANVGLPRGNVQRPNWIRKPSSHCSLQNYINGNTTSCIDASAFALPAPGTYGTSRRNSLTGPGYNNVDFSLFKNFNIWKSMKFQFRAETQNLFNHPSAGNPNSEIESSFVQSDPVGSSNFGTVTGTSRFYSPRSIQLAGKIVF